MPISILILTLDEEQNLPRCLKSVRWSDDVVVLDSFSGDRTVEIASQAGARVVQRRFDNWSAHQNWAVQNMQFRHPWVYYSDADEIVTPQLRDEMLAEAARPDNPNSAYRVRYKNYFWGRWIRHCGIYPVWTVRLFRPQKIRWERLVNPVPAVDGPVGRLGEHYEHHSFAKGLTAWLDKHNRYSLMEAQECIRSLNEGRLRWSEAFTRDPMARRRFLKELSFRLPCRSLLRFIYMYVLRMGFLDGWPGLEYCRLMAFYEHMIEIKVRELRRRASGGDI